MNELIQKLEDGILQVFETDRYKEYLKFVSKFHNYSYRNNILIQSQCPNARYVAGYKKWQTEFHRTVNAGEKGIRILAPVLSTYKTQVEKKDNTGKSVKDIDGKPVTIEKQIDVIYFKSVYVFDISQTTGEPLPTLTNELQGTKENFKDIIKCLQKVSPLPIEYEEINTGSKGYCSKDKIAIKKGMSEIQTIKTCIHEIAHATLHKDLKPDEKDRATKELEAESTAFIVCEHFGIDTSDYSFPYLASWSKDKELTQLKSSLETIQNQANTLICSIDKEYQLLLDNKLDKTADISIDNSNLQIAQEAVNTISENESTDIIKSINKTDFTFIKDNFVPSVTVINNHGFADLENNKTFTLDEACSLTKNIDNKLADNDKEQPITFRINYLFKDEIKNFEFTRYLGNNTGDILESLYKISKFYTVDFYGRSEIKDKPEKQKEYEFIYKTLLPYLETYREANKVPTKTVTKNIQSDFSPVVVITKNDTYDSYSFRKGAKVKLVDACSMTKHSNETCRKEKETHLMSFRIDYVLEESKKMVRHTMSIGNESGDILESLYKRADYLLHTQSGQVELSKMPNTSKKKQEQEFIYNFLSRYLDTHKVLSEMQQDAKYIIQGLYNTGFYPKVIKDLVIKIHQEIFNYISICRQTLNSGILEPPPITVKIEELEKNIMIAHNNYNKSQTELGGKLSNNIKPIIPTIKEKLDTVRFKNNIATDIDKKSENNIVNNANTSIDIKLDEDFKPYVTIIEGDGKDLKKGDELSISKLFETFKFNRALGNTSDIKFRITFLADNKKTELEVTQPLGIDIFDNIYDLTLSDKSNIAGYLSTHFALEGIEDLAKLGSQVINPKHSYDELKPISNQIDNELIKYVLDCRKILNSGNMNIPLTTPRLHDLVKNYNEVLENFESKNNKTNLWENLSENDLIKPYLEAVRYNEPLINSLLTSSNQLQDKSLSPTITIIWSEHERFKEGDCISLSQANFIFGEMDKKIHEDTKENRYYKVKFSINFFLENTIHHFKAKQYLGAGDGNLLEQLNTELICDAQNPRLTQEEVYKINNVREYFIPYLEQHCILDNLETSSKKEMSIINDSPISNDSTDKKLCYLNNVLDYVENCRPILNSGNIELPEMPKEPELTTLNTLVSNTNKLTEPTNIINNNSTPKQDHKRLSISDKMKSSKETAEKINAEKPDKDISKKNKSKESER